MSNRCLIEVKSEECEPQVFQDISPSKVNLQCALSSKSLAKKYQQHCKNAHKGEGDGYKCEECGKIFKSLKYFLGHRKGVHEKDPDYVCEHCGKCFASKDSMAAHRVCHTKEYEYRCDKCDQGYLRLSEFKAHQKSHADARITCQTCNKIYKNEYTFKEHVKLHEADYAPKEYRCELCSHVYLTKSGYYKHMKRHKGVKCTCEICGKTLADSTSLTLHKRIHSGERPYLCDTCGRGFTSKKTLTIHSVSHMNAKLL